MTKVYADFNGLFGDVLCLSHEETCKSENGEPIHLEEGMVLTAFDLDADEQGNRVNLLAAGVVEKSPMWLQCKGSKWVLRIDNHGVRQESEMRNKL